MLHINLLRSFLLFKVIDILNLIILLCIYLFALILKILCRVNFIRFFYFLHYYLIFYKIHPSIISSISLFGPIDDGILIIVLAIIFVSTYAYLLKQNDSMLIISSIFNSICVKNVSDEYSFKSFSSMFLLTICPI